MLLLAATSDDAPSVRFTYSTRGTAPSRGITTTTIGAVPVAEPSQDYADVTVMVRHLSTLDEQSSAYRRSRDAVVERCLPLAENIARRFRNRGEPFEDLVQVARIGLLQAVDRFDADAGSEFLAFAVPTMMGEIRRHFRDHGWSVKVPRRFKDLSSQLARARAELSQQLNRTPTASEIASHLELDRQEVVEAIIALSGYSTSSLDAPVPSDGDDGRTASHTFGGADANLDKVLDVETVRPLIAALAQRDRTVLKLRFFEHMTQTQIAERLGISQMHVSRLLARALAELRQQARTPEWV